MPTFSNCSIDLELARKGAPLITSGGTLIVRSSSRANPSYMKAVERMYRPYRRALAAGSLPFEKRQELDRALFIQELLVGWEDDVTWPVHEDGGLMSYDEAIAKKKAGEELHEEPLPFCRENVEMLFDAIPQIYEEAEFGAAQPEVFQSFEREEAAGN